MTRMRSIKIVHVYEHERLAKTITYRPTSLEHNQSINQSKFVYLMEWYHNWHTCN